MHEQRADYDSPRKEVLEQYFREFMAFFFPDAYGDVEWARGEVVNLFRFIDWLLRLPEEVEEMVWQEVRKYEEEKRKPYVTSVERIGFEKGVEQGLQQGRQQGLQQGRQQGLLAGIELGLELRFAGEGLRLLPELYKIEDVDVLRAVHEGIEAVSTPDELRRIYE